MNAPKLILASGSKDRVKSFQRAKLKFEVVVSDYDEDALKNSNYSPANLAEELARQKALNVKKKLESKEENAIIVAADTLVEFKGQIIGKAKDKTDAFQTLKKLSNNKHTLISAIAITETFNDKIVSDCDATAVSFNQLSDDEISNYISTGEWEGRAGAYSINDKAALFIDKIEGSPSTVMGIPMQKMFLILKREFNYNLMQLLD